MRIVVLEPLGLTGEELLEIGDSLIELGHEITSYGSRPQNEEELIERIEGADVLIVANMPLNAKAIASNPNIKMISVAFTGVDHIDMETCRKNNIMVCNAAGYSTYSVAELTFGLILSVLRNIVPLNEATREGKNKDGFSQNELYGKTLGIIGTGSIGTRVAEIAKVFGCNILAHSRTEKKSLIDSGIKYVSLETLLSDSDIVSIHVPLNEETNGLIGRDEISIMKPSSILINTARGPIVDEEVLAEALRNDIIAGAGVDVFTVEPPLPKTHPLLGCSNAIVTPHIAFATEEAITRRAHITFENITKYLKGNPQNIMK
ncbi:D-isomer-specific 2-hydroxyacid dehydrogenase [Clostridium putrefaciens]|uniref:D-isomer-specific 2-hydroxyacid dehydrogenase n=1 Tax=Clostridium putrefaciens TaxID=99675 RepID=A0A381J3Z2_9CLOT|nr:2-hydroxyacid dehydrogenase [Clostridium putrefaciens]SUY45491.1 D-isomer-specific 2-hydroxyacid dehydrogenase [Clostridium putrefaciens]